MANLRARMRDVTISGISLNCENFTERHGTEAFPLCGLGRPFYRMSMEAWWIPFNKSGEVMGHWIRKAWVQSRYGRHESRCLCFRCV